MAGIDRITVVFDLDDVLVEFVAPFFEWHNRRYGTDLTVEDIAEARYLFTRRGSLNRTGDGSPVKPPARRPVSSIGSYQLPTNGNWLSHLVLSGLLEATRRVVDPGPWALVASAHGLWGPVIYGQTENTSRNNP